MPDVIIAYDGLSPAGSRSAAMARRLNVPLFLFEQGFPLVGHPVERLMRFVGEQVWGRRLRRTVKHVVALDDLALRQAREFGIDPQQTSLISGGVDQSKFRSGMHSHLLERHGVQGRIVLAAGAFQSGRGLEKLVRAYASTLGASEDWTLVLAGEGPEILELRALGNIKGIAARMILVERPRPEELPALVSAATLMVDPDVSGRGPRRTTLGGLASGTPLLSVPGSLQASLVERGVGMLAEDDSEAALAHVLRVAASDPGRRARWSAMAKTLATQELAWDAVATRVEQLFLGDSTPHEMLRSA
jgi:glycosyltransferase involved in cell wall biosynthesis